MRVKTDVTLERSIHDDVNRAGWPVVVQFEFFKLYHYRAQERSTWGN